MSQEPVSPKTQSSECASHTESPVDSPVAPRRQSYRTIGVVESRVVIGERTDRGEAKAENRDS